MLTPDDRYAAYLQTEDWQRTRRMKLKVSPRCEFCGATADLEVHHTHYETLGWESLTDLQTLCGRCHDVAHGRDPDEQRDVVPF